MGGESFVQAWIQQLKFIMKLKGELLLETAWHSICFSILKSDLCVKWKRDLFFERIVPGAELFYFGSSRESSYWRKCGIYGCSENGECGLKNYNKKL